jgi:pimeloyl-ACP methyl ester carboxylesterase
MELLRELVHMRLLIAASLAALTIPAAAASQQTGAFISDRVSIAARGSGRDIILIPGLASSRDIWEDVAARLAGKYRLHLVQVRGFAGMPPRANATGLVSAPVANELARYIREAGLRKPAIIGHSMGGTIGMMLAARHPDLVGRLMVEDMPPYMGLMFGTNPDSVRRLADATRDSLVAHHARGQPGMLEQMYPTMTRVARKRATLLKGLRDSHRPTVANAFHELIVTDLRPELSKILVPVTVLYVVPPNQPMTAEQYDAMIRSAYATLRNGTVVQIADANHFIHFDQLERFLAEVDAFMRR